MSDNSRIVIDWAGLRSQANQVNSNVLPIFDKWEKAIDSFGEELDEYSSDFVAQVATLLHETSQLKINNALNELKQYISGLNSTADIHEQNEAQSVEASRIR